MDYAIYREYMNIFLKNMINVLSLDLHESFIFSLLFTYIGSTLVFYGETIDC